MNSENFVKIVSSDLVSFFVSREAAVMSPVIAEKLAQNGSEKIELKLRFDAEILEAIIDYLHFKKRHLLNQGQLPVFEFPKKRAVDVLKASLVFKI